MHILLLKGRCLVGVREIIWGCRLQTRSGGQHNLSARRKEEGDGPLT